MTDNTCSVPWTSEVKPTLTVYDKLLCKTGLH